MLHLCDGVSTTSEYKHPCIWDSITSPSPRRVRPKDRGAAGLDSHSKLLDRIQSRPFGIFLSFEQFHDLLEYILHGSDRITSLLLVRLGLTGLGCHLIHHLKIINILVEVL